MLEANPCMTWRDVQHIIVQSAVKNDPTDAEWSTNAAGLHVNQKYGFGAIDAAAAVQQAETWVSVASQLEFSSPQQSPNVPAPTRQQIYLSGCNADASTCIDTLEHVTLSVNITAKRRADVSLVLICPSGSQSTMLRFRKRDFSPDGIRKWTMMTTHCWGEPAQGNYTLVVEAQSAAMLEDWSITVRGTSLRVSYPAPTVQVPSTILSASQRKISPQQCLVCGNNAFRGVGGTCWRCHASCQYGCYGPGDHSCSPPPPLLFFSGMPSQQVTTPSLRGACIC